MNLRSFLLLGLLACLPVRAFAAFEDIGAGARPVAMGSAFAAVADDANTIYYNPAGLGRLKHSQLTAGYGRLYMGLSDGSNLGSGFIGVTTPLHDGAWGTLGFASLSLSLQGAYEENAYYLSYGRELMPSLYAGASLKMLRRSFGSDSYTQNDPVFQLHGRNTSSTSMDLGLLYRVSPYLSVSATAKDFNEPNVGVASTDKVPKALTLGGAYYQRSFVVGGSLTKKDKDTDFALGGERWFYKHWVAGRAGFEFGTRNKRNLTMGMGVRMGNAQIDYAFVLPVAGLVDTSGSHRISLTLRFGKVEAGPIALLEQEEMLGTATSSSEVEALRRELEHHQEEQEAYQRETDRLQARIVQLDNEIRSLRTTGVPANLPAGMVVSTPSVSAPAPAAVDAELMGRIERLEQELQQQRKDIELRKAKPVAPAAVAAPATGAAAPAFKRPGVYTVKEGDTLQSIAAYTLGDADRWAEIYMANKDRLKRGGAVTAGQALVIP